MHSSATILSGTWDLVGIQDSSMDVYKSPVPACEKNQGYLRDGLQVLGFWLSPGNLQRTKYDLFSQLGLGKMLVPVFSSLLSPTTSHISNTYIQIVSTCLRSRGVWHIFWRVFFLACKPTSEWTCCSCVTCSGAHQRWKKSTQLASHRPLQHRTEALTEGTLKALECLGQAFSEDASWIH